MFEIIEDNNDKKPLQVTKNTSQKVYFCKDFKGELSSFNGIDSKFLYIPKINELSGETSFPDIKLKCNDNCKDKCKYHRT